MAALETRIRRLAGRAIQEYGMIEDGDVVVVGVSGGKDSYTLLEVLQALARRAPVRFQVKGLLIDQGFVGFDPTPVLDFLEAAGVEHRVHEIDTLADEDLFGSPGGSFCAFCARQRRGVLYKVAREMGATKLALGHHREDVLETLLMNMFFAGTLRGMPARLDATGEGRGMRLIRPLVYVPEEWIAEHAKARGYPCVPCGCPTCGTNLQHRQRVKLLLKELEAEYPGVKKSLLASMKNVQAQQLLLDEEGRKALAARLEGTPPPPPPDAAVSPLPV